MEKLPGGLQKPILRELVPIRELFLEQRPARIVLLGDTGMSVPEFLHSVAGVLVETGESDHGWRSYRIAERGEILILDARLDTPQEVFDRALARFVPDAALLLRQSPADEAAFDLAAERMGVCPIETPLVAIPLGGGQLAGPPRGALEGRARIFQAAGNDLRAGDGRFGVRGSLRGASKRRPS